MINSMKPQLFPPRLITRALFFGQPSARPSKPSKVQQAWCQTRPTEESGIMGRPDAGYVDCLIAYCCLHCAAPGLGSLTLLLLGQPREITRSPSNSAFFEGGGGKSPRGLS